MYVSMVFMSYLINLPFQLFIKQSPAFLYNATCKNFLILYQHFSNAGATLCRWIARM